MYVVDVSPDNRAISASHITSTSSTKLIPLKQCLRFFFLILLYLMFSGSRPSDPLSKAFSACVEASLAQETCAMSEVICCHDISINPMTAIFLCWPCSKGLDAYVELLTI